MIELQQYRGDSVTYAIATSEQFDLTTAASVIFTAKKHTYDPDSDAIIQKILGSGLIVVDAHNLAAAIVPADTATLGDTALNLCWDVQVQESGGAVHTVAFGTLTIDRDVTIETVSSIPIFTTDPPAPGAGTGNNSYTHVQAVESNEWIINHNLGFWPVVEVFNSLGRAVTAGVNNTSLNQTRILFNEVTTGTARLI